MLVTTIKERIKKLTICHYLVFILLLIACYFLLSDKSGHINFGLITPLSIIAIIAFIGREAVKTIIKYSADKSLESVKSELNDKSKELELKLARLHNEQVDAIKYIYGGMSELQQRAEYQITTGSYDDRQIEECKQIIELYFETRVYYRKNKILLPKILCTKIDDFFKTLSFAVYHFKLNIEINTNPEHPNRKFIFETNSKRGDEAYDKLKGISPKILEELEDEYRIITGANQNTNK